jgi:hypothetical protein
LPDNVHAFDFGVPPPGDEMDMYMLTGQKNFKMEWAMMMDETIGREATCTIIRSLPDIVMFRPEELKAFVHEEIWNKLRW